MPRRTIVDPHWEPLCYVVKVRFTATQLHMLDQLVSELRVSRAWLLRMAVHRGLPGLVDDLRRRRRLGLSAGDTALAAYDEGSAALAAGRRLGGGRVDVAPRRAGRRAATRVPGAGGRMIPCCACTARDLAAGISRGARSSIVSPVCSMTDSMRAASRRGFTLRLEGLAAAVRDGEHRVRHGAGARFVRGRGPRARAVAAPRVVDLRRRARGAAPRGGACRSTIGGTVRIAPRPATGLEPAGREDRCRPWRDASVTDAPMRVRVSLRTAERHRSVRRRVRTGSTRRGSCPSERRRGAYASSNRLPLFGSAPPVAYRSGSRRVHSYRPPARRAAYRRVRASRFRHRRAASSLAVGSWASRARTETGGCLPPKAACCARRCVWCVLS